MNYVYIIHSVDLNRFYIGESYDVKNRIEEHNTKVFTNSFTSKASDWKLFLRIECENRIQARKIESHIKKMKSKKYIQDLKNYPEIIKKLKNKYN